MIRVEKGEDWKKFVIEKKKTELQKKLWEECKASESKIANWDGKCD